MQPLDSIAFPEAQERHALAGEALQPSIAVAARRPGAFTIFSPIRSARFGKIIVIARSSEAPALFFKSRIQIPRMNAILLHSQLFVRIRAASFTKRFGKIIVMRKIWRRLPTNIPWPPPRSSQQRLPDNARRLCDGHSERHQGSFSHASARRTSQDVRPRGYNRCEMGVKNSISSETRINIFAN